MFHQVVDAVIIVQKLATRQGGIYFWILGIVISPVQVRYILNARVESISVI